MIPLHPDKYTSNTPKEKIQTILNYNRYTQKGAYWGLSVIAFPFQKRFQEETSSEANRDLFGSSEEGMRDRNSDTEIDLDR